MRLEYERFIEKVERLPETGCWLWMGTTYRKGYGHFRRKINGKWIMYKAHRYSYEYHKGDIPEGLNVLHTCDISCCVNPDHLWVGTTLENVKDKINKGRHSFGRNENHHWLDQEFADLFREGWSELKGEITQYKYAQMIGISPQQLSRILSNKIWRNPKFAA